MPSLRFLICDWPFRLFAALALGMGVRIEAAVAAPPPLATARLLASGQKVRIVAFGDSLTGVYYHSGGRRGWCDLLGLALQRIYPNSDPEMINAGVSGNTAADALQRIDRDVLGHHPQLVVVMFGLNDVARDTPLQFHDNLVEIVGRVRRAGSEVILMTPNSVNNDDPRRPRWKVSEYVEIVRQVARESAVPLADCFKAFEEVRTVSREAWVHLMSETIHPNLRGQKIFAEEAAWVISRHRISLDALPRHQPGLPAVLEKLRQREAVRIVAMEPVDGLIGPALKTLYPNAQLEITGWDPHGKSLSQLAGDAQGRAASRASTRTAPDLIVLAIPADALGSDGEQFYRAYSMILNASLPFGKSAGKEGWNCVAVLPSVLTPEMDEGQKAAERLAADVVQDKDIDYLRRSPGDTTSASELLTTWLKALLQ